eukprot:CAMPEP_0198120170 /NCGR_PEP_ID=MMETSP1442-20131203/28187_1 /TAXON_ID= /ORGANISM="Craspedostauros australis, Strain CCMP3328" /LENGTH=63 /DNA_ID=CAMNT_0043778775 /DNA_START=73 /DNA_END=264 /DNA_ORIENTATION=+
MPHPASGVAVGVDLVLDSPGTCTTSSFFGDGSFIRFAEDGFSSVSVFDGTLDFEVFVVCNKAF